MIGDRLKQLRGKRTQEEIANLLGITRARYSHYENNRSEPNLDMIRALARFYSVSADVLLELEELEESPPSK